MAGGARAIAEVASVEAAMTEMSSREGKRAGSRWAAGFAERAKAGSLAALAVTGGAAALAMSGPFAAAGLAVGAFGAVAIPVLHKVADAHTALTAAQQQYNKAVENEKIQLASATSAKQAAQIEASASKQKQMALYAEKQATDGLTSSQKGLMGQVAQLGKAWNGIEAALTPLVVDVAKVAISVAQDLMPAFKALAEVGGNALETILGYLGQLFRSPFFAQFIAQMSQLASQVAPMLGQALTGLLKVFMQLFEQSGPAGVQLLQVLLPLIVRLAGDLVPVITGIAEVVAAVLKWLEKTHLLIPALAAIGVAIMILSSSFMPWLIAIALVAAAGVELAKNWHQIWHAIAHDFDVARHFIAHVLDDIVHFAEIPLKWIKGHWPLLLGILLGPIALAAALIYMHWRQILHGAEIMVSGVASFFRSLPGRILHALGDMGRLLYSAGKAVVEGLIHGIEDMAGSAVSTVENIGSSLLHGAMSVLGIGSPSKEFYKLGSFITQGLAAGLKQTAQQAVDEARRLGNAVTAAAASGQITASQEFSLEARISSALSAAISRAKARSAAIELMQQNMGLALRQGLMQGLEGTASQVKSSVAKLAAMVKEAMDKGLISHGRADSLTAWLEGDNTRLQDLANRRASIVKQIAAARQFAAQTASSVAGNYALSGFAMSGANGGVATVGQIVSGLRLDVSHIRKFTANIKKLAREGLNRNYLSQLIQMGPEQGGALADELAAAGLGDIKAINSAEYQISQASGQLGKTAANAMYDSGKNAGKRFLSGLEAQQKQIEKLMAKIARSMVDTIKKELGIHSPSTVLRYHGQMAGEGFALGIGDQAQRVAQSSQRLAQSAVPRQGGYGAYGGGGGGGRYELVLRFEKTGDPLIDEVLHGLRGKVRKLGGDPDMFTKKVAFR